MPEKTVREKLKDAVDLEKLHDEYGRILENEMIYLDEIGKWEKLRKASILIVGIAMVSMLASVIASPNTSLDLESFQQYPLQSFLLWGSIGTIIVMAAASSFVMGRISRIRDELALHSEEGLFLRAYETYSSIDSYLKESNPKRKLYFKRDALKNAEELTQIADGWKYGNIRLITDLVKDKIDLLKDNIRRLLLSNIAKGDEAALARISQVLVEFCKYILSPSLEKLDGVNGMIKELPYKEYKPLTGRDRLSGYFSGKPRFSRLLFAGGITATVIIILWYSNQNLGVIFAVAVTCFWGAFSGFDKLFKIRS